MTNTTNNEGKFRAGDRVVHLSSSQIPEGAKGTVLGRAPAKYQGRWEVEYDEHPCQGKDIPECKSPTSWLSRETSIELTREEALKRSAA